MSRGVVVRRTTLADPVARRLVHEQWTEIMARYRAPAPCGEEDSIPTGTFEPPDGAFLLLEVDGEPLGCGGIRPCAEGGAGTAEIKRMFVRAAGRGRGLGRVVLAELERAAVGLGYRRMWLETGTEQPEALSLYETAGYRRIAPYGEYRDEDDSRCYEKDLGPLPGADPAVS